MLDWLFSVIIHLTCIGFIYYYALIGLDVVAGAMLFVWNTICWIKRFVGGKR